MMSYIKEFTRLSRYASGEVSADTKRVKRFLRSLDPYAAMQMKLTNPHNFQELMDTAITWENHYRLVQLSRQKKAKTEAKRVQPTHSTPNLKLQAEGEDWRCSFQLENIYTKESNPMP
jgi:hypothetical protein